MAKTQRSRYWPFWLLLVQLAGIFVAVAGVMDATNWVERDPCVGGRDVPTWPILIAVLGSTLLLYLGVLIVTGIRKSPAWVAALVVLVIGIALTLLTFVFHALPYGWHCPRY